ncbi:MAG: TSUP family transporter, partial [Rhizomicrobium sp.]
MIFLLAVLIVAFAGGVMTAVAGMGVGSVLVPLLALRLDFKLAVAAAALPHLIATALRAVRLWKAVDAAVFFNFGLVCVIASFVGAMAQPQVSTAIMIDVFA